MNQKVEIHKLPLEQQAPRFKELQSSISKGPRLVRLLASVKAQETEGWQREQARLHCAIAALAVERFRQEHGRWPGTLADLVPEFLPALPIDPYTRTHLGYHRQKEGVVVFSHGLDTTLYSDRATTDAANNIFETLNNVMQTDKLGFRLWATHLRRQRQE